MAAWKYVVLGAAISTDTGAGAAGRKSSTGNWQLATDSGRLWCNRVYYGR